MTTEQTFAGDPVRKPISGIVLLPAFLRESSSGHCERTSTSTLLSTEMRWKWVLDRFRRGSTTAAHLGERFGFAEGLQALGNVILVSVGREAKAFREGLEHRHLQAAPGYNLCIATSDQGRFEVRTVLQGVLVLDVSSGQGLLQLVGTHRTPNGAAIVIRRAKNVRIL
jgi:hypothetical protein